MTTQQIKPVPRLYGVWIAGVTVVTLGALLLGWL